MRPTAARRARRWRRARWRAAGSASATPAPMWIWLPRWARRATWRWTRGPSQTFTRSCCRWSTTRPCSHCRPARGRRWSGARALHAAWGRMGGAPVLLLLLPPTRAAANSFTPPPGSCGARRYLAALRSCYSASGKALVAFERYMTLRKSGGNHCHLNVIAVAAPTAERARQVGAPPQALLLGHVPPPAPSNPCPPRLARGADV